MGCHASDSTSHSASGKILLRRLVRVIPRDEELGAVGPRPGGSSESRHVAIGRRNRDRLKGSFDHMDYGALRVIPSQAKSGSPNVSMSL